MPFHPTGPSKKITLANTQAETQEIGSSPVIRLVPVTFPSAAMCYLALGTDGVSVNSSNGMPISLALGREEIIALSGETHIAMLMMSNSNYEIMVTPGEII